MSEHDPDDLRLIQQLREEIDALRKFADAQAVNMVKALGSRDLIGQAKGITMAAMHCTADEAFAVLKAQSQAQNRKLVEIAAEVVESVVRRARADPPAVAPDDDRS